ncbi:MAG TPA: class I SAM-dependent methyltransferase [Thermoanaerobaculia bacterium]|nr:class I SAM-dependent methyltransferase [Thermoanaerobaculia bacterium]
MAPRHERCWDAGTGSGQAAVPRAEHFAEVVATDASADQIAHATPHPRVTYRVTPAERSGLKDGWADLVTVGQAVHWFALKTFYEEVRRAGAPGGALAMWAYDLLDLEGEAGAVFRRFHARVEPYWPPERALVARRYADLPFPFEEIPVSHVDMTARWDLERTLGYLSTWSAVKAFQKANQEDPIATLAPELAAVWGSPAALRTVTWPLILRAGRIA